MKKFLLLSFLYIICHVSSAQKIFYNVVDYGADITGNQISTGAIQNAIDDCAEIGGGTVYFPAGQYLSGTVFLKNNVSLHLEPGAILEGSKNLSDYPIVECGIRSYTDNYTNKSLIYGEGLKNISITGQGTIDGNGSAFKVERMKNDESVRQKDGFAFYKSRPYMIRIIDCENVSVKDINIINSPMWVQHYLACNNVVIDGITVESKVNFNNDGIDIDACENVRISNCNIHSGDDAIVLKSTMDKVCKNVAVTNCILNSNCNGFKLGTESNGGFENISFSNCIIHNTRLAGIALELVDGGGFKNILVSNVNMDTVGCAIFIRLGDRARPYKENMEKPGMGSLNDIMISNIQASYVGRTGCSVTGLPGYLAGNITLNNIRLNFEGGGAKEFVTREIEEFPDKYPEFGMFGILPAYGFFCRHISGLTMENIELSYEYPDYRPAIYFNDVMEGRIKNLKASCEEDTETLMIIHDSKNIVVSECDVSKNTGALAYLKGSSDNVAFINNNLFNSIKIYKKDPPVKDSGIIVK